MYALLPARVWIVLFWCLLMGITLLTRPILPIDETRYIAVAWEMWVRGDYLVPDLNNIAYSHKPPLLFWLMQLSWFLFGGQRMDASFDCTGIFSGCDFSGGGDGEAVVAGTGADCSVDAFCHRRLFFLDRLQHLDDVRYATGVFCVAGHLQCVKSGMLRNDYRSLDAAGSSDRRRYFDQRPGYFAPCTAGRVAGSRVAAATV